MKGWKMKMLKEGNMNCPNCKNYNTHKIARTDEWQHYECLICKCEWQMDKFANLNKREVGVKND